MARPPTVPVTAPGASTINWLREIANNKIASQGRLYAREVGGTKMLFVRSAGADRLMKLFAPERHRQQKQLARQLIGKALTHIYPGLPSDQLLGMVGIAPNSSLRLKAFRAIGKSAEVLIKAKVREDVAMTLRHGNLNLRGWQLADSPGLDCFFNLRGQDLAIWSNHRTLGTSGGLLAFQALLSEAVGRLPVDPAGNADKRADVVKFLSTWAHMQPDEKRALHDQLSPDGRTALAAVDAVTPRLVNALQLPIAPAGHLGLDDTLAADAGIRNSLDNVARTIAEGKGKPPRETREGVTQAADGLAAKLSDAVREHLATLSPSVPVMPAHALKQCVRAFIDQHMNPAAFAGDNDGWSSAIRFWVDNKDAFIDRVCSGIQHRLLSPASLDNGILVLEKARCRVVGELGAGAEGKVHLAHLESGNGSRIAVKTLAAIDHGQYGLCASPREALLHQLAASTKSPHIVGFIDAGSAADGSVMLAMEFAPNGSLDDAIKGLNARRKADDKDGAAAAMPALCRHVLREMASGLSALHALGLRHRDIKGGNLYIGDGGVLKVGDFGRSVLASEDISAERPNDTPAWLAPEFGQPSGLVQYTSGADIWAAGIVMLELATGKPSPFERDFKADSIAALEAFRTNPDHLDPARRRHALGLDALHKQDPDLADLLLDMLHPRSSDRLSADAVLARLPAATDPAGMRALLIELAGAGRAST